MEGLNPMPTGWFGKAWGNVRLLAIGLEMGHTDGAAKGGRADGDQEWWVLISRAGLYPAMNEHLNN